MRLTIILAGALAALLVLLALPAALACGGGSSEPDPAGCPAYTVEVTGAPVDDEYRGFGVAANEHGQLGVYAEDVYFFWDYTLFVTGTDYLFSMWFYSESNGEPGPQRHDEFCQQAPPEDADVIWC